MQLDDAVAQAIEALPQVSRVKIGPPTARCETGDSYVVFQASTPDGLVAAVADQFGNVEGGTLYWRYDERVRNQGTYARLVITDRPEILRWDPDKVTELGQPGDFVEIGAPNA